MNGTAHWYDDGAPAASSADREHGRNQADVVLFALRILRDATRDDVMVWLRAHGYDWPVSSVTRALACLKRDGHVERLEERRPGRYGRGQHVWRPANPQLYLL